MRGSIVCPNTEAVIDFEAPYSEAKLCDVWHATFEIDCPVCSGRHEIGCATAYKQGVMAQFECPIESASVTH